MGETAPLLILVGYSQAMNFDMFSGFMGSLPGMMYDQTVGRRGRQSDSHRAAVGRRPDADPADRRHQSGGQGGLESLRTRKARQEL